MVRALFTEVRLPVGGLGLTLAALVPGLLLLSNTDLHVAFAWGLIAFGSLVGTISVVRLYYALTGFLKRRRNSVTILDGWHCHYRGKQI